MNTEVKAIGRMTAMHDAAARNGWLIVDVQANQTEAVVLFNRGRGPFGPERYFGTAYFSFDAKTFFWGNYDQTYDQARVDYAERCSRTFPV